MLGNPHMLEMRYVNYIYIYEVAFLAFFFIHELEALCASFAPF